MPYTFRPAVESDVQAIADIYNASVMAGGATADLAPRTFDQRRAWVESHTPPYGVFVVESEDGSIIGFGALSVFYDRAGYDGVTDLAYYIDPAWQGRGVGTFMLDRLLTEALARHMRKACGIIFADNGLHCPHAPLRLHPIRTHARRCHRLHRHHARHVLLVFGPVAPRRFTLALHGFRCPITLKSCIGSALFLERHISDALIPDNGKLRDSTRFSSVLTWRPAITWDATHVKRCT